MNVQAASARWMHAQAKTIRSTYLKAWQTGKNAYHAEPARQARPERRRKPQPTQPATTPERQALTPALNSLARMGAQLALLLPTAAQVAEAGSLTAAMVLLVKAWLKSNAYRLAGAASVAWAGEQHGYAQAADADGLVLSWQLDAGANHCADCVALAGLPAMPLEEWPTMPGDGATECGMGCKCSMSAEAAPVPVLTGEQLATVTRIVSQVPQPIPA